MKLLIFCSIMRKSRMRKLEDRTKVSKLGTAQTGIEANAFPRFLSRSQLLQFHCVYIIKAEWKIYFLCVLSMATDHILLSGFSFLHFQDLVFLLCSIQIMTSALCGWILELAFSRCNFLSSTYLLENLLCRRILNSLSRYSAFRRWVIPSPTSNDWAEHNDFLPQYSIERV